MKRHVETSIFREIVEAVAYAREARRAVAISGAPGLGKTHALTWIFEREPLAAYWSVPTARARLKGATKAIVEALGYRAAAEHCDQLWEQLEAILEGCEGDAFLIIDEAQRLPLDILVEIVDFPERHGFPVVIAGNPELLRRTRVKSGAFDQISSRCAKQVTLRKPLPDDLNILAADFDVTGKEARDAAIAYGLNTSIRELVTLLEAARGVAGRAPVHLSELRMAAKFSKGDRGLSLLKPDA